LGVGGYLGYKTLTDRTRVTTFSYDWRWTYLIMGVRGAWHYNEWHGVSELDVYGGLMLSYNSVTWTDRTDYPAGFPAVRASSASGIALTGFLGARYYFTDNLAVHLEGGYGIAVLNLGLTYKF
jgi:hypothetical protein